MDFLPANFFFVEQATSDDVSRRGAQRENTSRPAVCEYTHITIRHGQQRITTPIEFPVVFRSEPHVTTGTGTIRNPAPNLWHDPVGHQGVYQWRRDDNGNYTGAYIWVRVDLYPMGTGDAATAPAIHTQHYFTFSGIAIKSLPVTSLDPSLTPRAVGL